MHLVSSSWILFDHFLADFWRRFAHPGRLGGPVSDPYDRSMAKRLDPQVRLYIEQQYSDRLGKVPEPEDVEAFQAYLNQLQELEDSGEAKDHPVSTLKGAVFDTSTDSVLAGEAAQARQAERAREATAKLFGDRDQEGTHTSRRKVTNAIVAVGMVLMMGGLWAFWKNAQMPVQQEQATAQPNQPQTGVSGSVDQGSVDVVKDPAAVYGDTKALDKNADKNAPGQESVAGVKDTPVVNPPTTVAPVELEPGVTAAGPVTPVTLEPSTPPSSSPVVVAPSRTPSRGSGESPSPVILEPSSPPSSSGQQATAVPVRGPVSASAPSPQSGRPVKVVPIEGPAAAAVVLPDAQTAARQPVVLAGGSDASMEASAPAATSPLPAGVVDPSAQPAQPATQAESQQPAGAPRSSRVYGNDPGAPAARAAVASGRPATVYRATRQQVSGRVYSAGAQPQGQGSAALTSQPAAQVQQATSPASATQPSSGSSVDSQVSDIFGSGGGSQPASVPQGSEAAPAAAPAATSGVSSAAPATPSVRRSGLVFRAQPAVAPAAAQPAAAAAPAGQSAATAAGAASSADRAGRPVAHPAGSLVGAKLVLKLVAPEGGQAFAVAKLDSGETAIGTAVLQDGRVQVNFTRLVTPAGESAIQARAIGADGGVGIKAAVIPRNPTFLTDLIRTAFGGAASYFQQFTAKSTTQYVLPNGMTIGNTSSAPTTLSLKDSVLSSLAGSVQMPATEGIKFVNVAEVPQDSGLQLVFF